MYAHCKTLGRSHYMISYYTDHGANSGDLYFVSSVGACLPMPPIAVLVMAQDLCTTALAMKSTRPRNHHLHMCLRNRLPPTILSRRMHLNIQASRCRQPARVLEAHTFHLGGTQSAAKALTAATASSECCRVGGMVLG